VANGYTATEPYTPDDPPGPESGFEPAVSEDRTDPEQGDIVLDVRRAVAGLPPEEREVVEAVFFDGFTQSEYAEFRGVSTSWVSRVLDKAKAGLRTELRHYALQQND
jgi:RNA polymerase sigma factor (sigma-70 family)